MCHHTTTRNIQAPKIFFATCCVREETFILACVGCKKRGNYENMLLTLGRYRYSTLNLNAAIIRYLGIKSDFDEFHSVHFESVIQTFHEFHKVEFSILLKICRFLFAFFSKKKSESSFKIVRCSKSISDRIWNGLLCSLPVN